MYGIFTTLSILLSVVASVHGHGLITAVSGANGVKGVGFAVVNGTPRDTGLPIKAVEGDTSIIRDAEIKSGKVQGCGRTEFNGNTDVASALSDATSAGLPTVGADGSVTMTLHQVNQDGAGPYSCDVSASGSAADFVAMQVTKNVPGTVAGLSLASATDFPLVAQMPAGMTCTGGPSGDACIVRCRNKALAGPFGGCAAVANAGAAAGNSTAAAAAPATAAASTASEAKTTKKGKFGFFARAEKETADVRKRWISSRVVAKGAAWV